MSTIEKTSSEVFLFSGFAIQLIKMWLRLVENFILGFAISAVPGAVFVETIRRTLFDKKTIIQFLSGNFVGMLIIVVSVFSGLALIINDPTTSSIFYAICGSVLIMLGISSIFIKPSYDTKKVGLTKNKSNYAAFATGFLLSVANPLSIIFCISIIGKIIQDTNSTNLAIINSLSVIAGSIVLFVILVMIIGVLHVRVNVRNLTLLSRVFGIVLLMYGLVTFSKIV